MSLGNTQDVVCSISDEKGVDIWKTGLLFVVLYSICVKLLGLSFDSSILGLLTRSVCIASISLSLECEQVGVQS